MDEGPYTARVTNPLTPPTPRLISIDRQQILLCTVDVEKLRGAGHAGKVGALGISNRQYSSARRYAKPSAHQPGGNLALPIELAAGTDDSH
jgi:hypothetical protein